MRYKSLYWIGVRESEIEYATSLFKGSITYYGSNRNGNYAFDKEYKVRVNCNDDSDLWIDFVNQSVKKIADIDSDCKFLLYYPADYPYFSNFVKDRVVYINDIRIIGFLESKIMTKIWLAKESMTTPFIVLKGSQIYLSNLRDYFENYHRFVVQADLSCGGSDTWLLSEATKEEIYKKIKPESTYIVSPYFAQSVSVNVHLVISKRKICILPPSIQIISLTNHCFTYNGADFIAYQSISKSVQKSVVDHAEIIGKKLQELGYIGVCGIDFLICREKVYFMEINSRFQASTMALNRSLADKKLNLSIQKMHIKAFENNSTFEGLTDFSVNYSFCYFTYNKTYSQRLKYLHSLKNNDDSFAFIDDALDWSAEFEEKAYLFEALFKNNIVAISPDGECVVDENTIINADININNEADNMLALKIMLLNQGLRITKRAETYANLYGGLNYEEFDAIDMEFNGFYLNVPYKTKTSQISPFEIDLDDFNHYILRFWGKLLGNVRLRYRNAIGEQRINNKFICDDITYLGNDRLRIFFRNSCYFKRNHLSCKFCDIVDDDFEFEFEEIQTAIDYYWDCRSINHYLIGGGANSPSSDFSEVIKIAEYLRSKTDKPIALMSLPPTEQTILQQLKRAGITEVVFNLEVYDRKIAKKIMPGKGAISLETYINAFKKSVELWGNSGNVRTIFIVGLESKTSLLEGIETVCRIGVSPTLSLFKPIPGTELESMIPPSNNEIYDLYKRIIEICDKYNVPLGPSCKYCQDNVLKIDV